MLTQWRGRDVLDPKHVEHLDRHAAELEFGQGISRPEAEEKAYKSYRVKNYIEAAAHHWKAFTAASAVADPSSKEHKMMYDVYLRALGHNPAGPVPPEVKQVLPDVNQKRTKFLAHAADQLPLLRSELREVLPLAKLLVDVMKLSKSKDMKNSHLVSDEHGVILSVHQSPSEAHQAARMRATTDHKTFVHHVVGNDMSNAVGSSISMRGKQCPSGKCIYKEAT